MRRVRKPWAEAEVRQFLELKQDGCTAWEIARQLGRTLYAVQGMRLKLVRALELGAKGAGVVRLLMVSEHKLNHQRTRKVASSTRVRGYKASLRRVKAHARKLPARG